MIILLIRVHSIIIHYIQYTFINTHTHAYLPIYSEISFGWIINNSIVISHSTETFNFQIKQCITHPV